MTKEALTKPLPQAPLHSSYRRRPVSTVQPRQRRIVDSGLRRNDERGAHKAASPSSTSLVIPAKAGIHRPAAPTPDKWIPACAGMTKEALTEPLPQAPFHSSYRRRPVSTVQPH